MRVRCSWIDMRGSDGWKSNRYTMSFLVVETAPLLNSTTDDHVAHEEDYSNRSRALTKTERLLAIAAILSLLLAAVFIGLFAGTANQLKKARHQPAPTHTHVPSGDHKTATVTATTTVSQPVPTAQPDPKNKTCLSRECILLASEILQNIDDTVDPCEDFYMFASKP